MGYAGTKHKELIEYNRITIFIISPLLPYMSIDINTHTRLYSQNFQKEGVQTFSTTQYCNLRLIVQKNWRVGGKKLLI